jgi:hypothetical protein
LSLPFRQAYRFCVERASKNFKILRVFPHEFVHALFRTADALWDELGQGIGDAFHGGAI